MTHTALRAEEGIHYHTPLIFIYKPPKGPDHTPASNDLRTRAVPASSQAGAPPRYSQSAAEGHQKWNEEGTIR